MKHFTRLLSIGSCRAANDAAMCSAKLKEVVGLRPMTKPKLAKAHSALMAAEYIRLGWTLKREFYAAGDDEPYEYLFEWQQPGEPISFDHSAFIRRLWQGIS